MRDDSSNILRQLLLALLLFALAGIAVELLLLRHYEDAWMLAPFVVSAIAAAATLVRLVRPGAASVRWLRASMLLLLAAGAAGVWLHYAGGLEFQTDMDPTLSRSQLFWKVLHMQAPPALAPGVLVQLGLLGLIATYKDPLASKDPLPSR
jgi:hypothetical protein